MERSIVRVCVATAAVAAMLLPDPTIAQDTSPLAGVWTLNRSLSVLPREIGFNVAWMPSPSSAGENAGSSGGGRGRRSAGGDRGASGNSFTPRESYEDARRLQVLTGAARNPPVRLMIVDAPTAVVITNEFGQSQTLHPDGKEAPIELEGASIPVTAKRDGSRLIVTYRAEQDREVRYTYSHGDNPSQLIVELQFLERGAGDKARLVYEPGAATETVASPASAPAPSNQQGTETFDERPGAELKGLKSLGILVEDLSAQAVACGLNHDALEAALSKRLTDGGLSVRKNSDDDTYVYVNVMTSSLSNGMCVSRYDAFLYTHATANLSYRDRPVLVQVSLMHRGGIGASAPAAHPAAVARGLENYVDLIVSQIRDANK